jgi:hypothetical protein
MDFTKITENRERAVKSCQAEEARDADSKLQLLAMAEGWELLADKLGQKDANGQVTPF